MSRHCTGNLFPECLTGTDGCYQKRWNAGVAAWVPPSVSASKISGLTLVSRGLNLVTLEEEETSYRNPQPFQPLPLPPRACAACIQGMIWGRGLDLAHKWADLPAGPGGCLVAMGLWLLLSPPTQHRAEGYEAQHSWVWSMKPLLCQKEICFPITQKWRKKSWTFCPFFLKFSKPDGIE